MAGTNSIASSLQNRNISKPREILCGAKAVVSSVSSDCVILLPLQISTS
jgi:hypothetical protein